MTQQTALEWFLEAIGYKQESDRITIINIHPDCDITDLIRRAKQIEKEQIMNAYDVAYQHGCDRKDITSGNIYYNETYNK